jgi:hypothetical protein
MMNFSKKIGSRPVGFWALALGLIAAGTGVFYFLKPPTDTTRVRTGGSQGLSTSEATPSPVETQAPVSPSPSPLQTEVTATPSSSPVEPTPAKATSPKPSMAPSPAGPGFTLSPSTVTRNQEYRANGGGCAGSDYGVTLDVYDPSGQNVDGSGGATLPDGSWSVPMSVGATLSTGKYTVTARCVSGSTSAATIVFKYKPQFLTVT